MAGETWGDYSQCSASVVRPGGRVVGGRGHGGGGGGDGREEVLRGNHASCLY